jgi:hypothetical protein
VQQEEESVKEKYNVARKQAKVNLWES